MPNGAPKRPRSPAERVDDLLGLKVPRRDSPRSLQAMDAMESPSNRSLRHVRAHSVAASEMYTVIVRGQPFYLTRSMILTDSPNWFTSAFLGDFTEAESGVVSTDRSPVLFALIIEYLSGYEVIPLEREACPPGMSLEATKRNLYRDAVFFGLDGLAALLTPPQIPAPQPRVPPMTDTGRDSWNGAAPRLAFPVELRAVTAERRQREMEWTPHGLVVKPAAANARENRMVPLIVRDVQMIIELRPWVNSVQWSYHCLHPSDWSAMEALLEPGSAPIAGTGGCSCVGLSRQLRFSINDVDCSPDTLLLCRHALLNKLDEVIMIPFKRFAAEEAIRISIVCDRLVLALCQGASAPYLAPLDVRGKTSARWWADYDETEPARDGAVKTGPLDVDLSVQNTVASP